MNIPSIALRLALATGACALANGCQSTTPIWDRTFGDAVNQLVALQTINRNASENNDPVAGVDGTTATAAQQNYGKSFVTPTPPVNMFTIGVSGGSSGN